jgi:hypothetical protein
MEDDGTRGYRLRGRMAEVLDALEPHVQCWLLNAGQLHGVPDPSLLR